MPVCTDDQQKVLENHRRQPERSRLDRRLGQRQRHLERMVGVVSKTGEHSITIVGIALLASSRNRKGSLGRNTLGLIEVRPSRI
jgi:hypothetical protein